MTAKLTALGSALHKLRFIVEKGTWEPFTPPEAQALLDELERPSLHGNVAVQPVDFETVIDPQPGGPSPDYDPSARGDVMG